MVYCKNIFSLNLKICHTNYEEVMFLVLQLFWALVIVQYSNTQTTTFHKLDLLLLSSWRYLISWVGQKQLSSLDMAPFDRPIWWLTHLQVYLTLFLLWKWLQTVVCGLSGTWSLVFDDFMPLPMWSLLLHKNSAV